MSGERAHAEISLAMRMRVQIDGVDADLVSYTRLNYRIECREGHWRIKSLAAVYEYTTLDPAIPGQVIAVPAEELIPFRTSYALLGWFNARGGRSISSSELGDDRPTELAAFYADTWTWLNANN